MHKIRTTHCVGLGGVSLRRFGGDRLRRAAAGAGRRCAAGGEVRNRRPRCSRAAASGVSKRCSGTSPACRRPSRVTRAAAPRTPPTTRSAAARPATPNRWRSPTTRRRSRTASCCACSFPSRTTRRELNRQGPDVGTQYRSAIFYANDEQKRVAEAYIAQLGAAKAFPGPIVTQVAPLTAFYPAEDYHQNYLALHPTRALHRLQRPAEARRAEDAVSRPVHAK